MKRERWAWLVPVLGAGLVSTVEKQLVDNIGDARAAAAYFYVGVVFGWAWYQLFPRPLAARLAGLAAVAAVGFLILFGGGDVSGDPLWANDLIAPGVLVGLVLTERWKEEVPTALTSRETMRELR